MHIFFLYFQSSPYSRSGVFPHYLFTSDFSSFACSRSPELLLYAVAWVNYAQNRSWRSGMIFLPRPNCTIVVLSWWVMFLLILLSTYQHFTLQWRKPLEWTSPHILRRAVSQLGKVQDVKTDNLLLLWTSRALCCFMSGGSLWWIPIWRSWHDDLWTLAETPPPFQSALLALPSIPAKVDVTLNPGIQHDPSGRLNVVNPSVITTDLVPYDVTFPSSTGMDESLLLDAPVFEATFPDLRALAAGPKQPPGSKWIFSLGIVRDWAIPWQFKP